GLENEELPFQLDRPQWPSMKDRFAELFRTKTRDEWAAILEGTDACAAPVLSLSEAHTHPHNRARGTFVEKDGILQPAPAPRFSRTPPEISRPAPAPGADNDKAGSFWLADLDEAAKRLAAILDEERADALTVYDDNGSYGHPDHIQVHRVGTRAAELAGTPRVYEATINRDHLKRIFTFAM